MIIYTAGYYREGQSKSSEIQIAVPEGEKEVFLPEKCKLVNLYDQHNRVVKGASQRLVADESGEIKALFGM